LAEEPFRTNNII